MKIILKIMLLLSFSVIFAQSVYNEDIDFNKTYPVSNILPAAKLKNKKIVNQIKSSLKNINWINKGKIKDIYIIDKNWTIQRNEFTGITKSRYLTAIVFFEYNGDSKYYYLIPCYFMQNASVFGLKYGKVYYRMVLHYKIEKIKK